MTEGTKEFGCAVLAPMESKKAMNSLYIWVWSICGVVHCIACLIYVFLGDYYVAWVEFFTAFACTVVVRLTVENMELKSWLHRGRASND